LRAYSYVRDPSTWIDSMGLSGCSDAADGLPAADSELVVLGRQVDTAVAKEWPGHQVLDIPDWTLGKNDAWVQSAIDRNANVYLASPQNASTLFDTVAGRPTVFARELGQFFDAGYTQAGDYMIPPIR
jgi:hypothetical protein